MSEETRPVVVWVRIPGIGRVHQTIDIPADCFDSDGDIVRSDAIEFVEIWMQDILKMGYGVCKKEEEMPVDMDLNIAYLLQNHL